MTDTFVCGECEQKHKNSALKTVKFMFPRKDQTIVTVDVNLCTRCFVNGGLSERQEGRIRRRILTKLQEQE